MTNEEVVKEIKDKAYAAGFRAAREKAVDIASDHNGCVDVKCLSESNCGATIAQCIGSLEP